MLNLKHLQDKIVRLFLLQNKALRSKSVNATGKKIIKKIFESVKNCTDANFNHTIILKDCSYFSIFSGLKQGVVYRIT